MVMVNRNCIRLLTAWLLATALLTAFGSDALAATGSRIWGRRSPSLSTQTTLSSSQQVHKPVIRPFSGEPDQPGAPQPNSAKDGGVSGGQLAYWQLILQGLLPVLGGRVP